MPTLTNVRYKGRTDTEAKWISSNPILLEGEPAYSSDKNHRYKIGDGHSHWNELEYSGYKIGANLTVDDDDVTVSVTKENVVNALGYTPPKTDTTYTNATIQSAGLMSAADKAKLNTIEEGANHYTHPSYLARRSGFYKVTVDDEGHVSGVDNVVKNDITALGIPSQDTTYSNATTSLDGLLSSEDKTKLDGIASGANKYTHPSYTTRSSGLYKITVDAQGHVSNVSAVTKSDITALGIPGQDTNTTYTLGSFGITATAAEINKLDGLTATTAELNYVDGVTSNIQTQLNGKSPTTHSHSAATTSANGFMSSSDKSKLDGIASGANKYTHPSYTARSSGLYKVTVDSQGHVSSVSNVTKSDITNLGIPGQDTNTWTAFKGATTSTDGTAGYVPAPSAGSATRYFRSDGTWAVPPNTTYSVASTSTNGLMSASDKTKLDGIATGATRVLVDSSITERSSNPVRSSAIYSALAGKVPTSRTVNGKALSGNITLTANDVKAIPSSSKGANNGVAELDSSGKVPSSQLPSYVDDVIEGYLSGGKFYKESEHTTGIVGETGKIYVNLSDGKTYRWSGSAYVEISASLALGETSSTAYRGDRGAIAYNHSQTAHAPSNAERNLIVGIKKNGSAVSIGSDRTVNITVPTKVSELTNDSGYKTTDNNTTYTLKKDGNTITLTGSDGSKSNVTDANTTYSVASASANGLMSASDKTKLDGIASGANKYTHPSYTAKSSGLYKVTVDAQGHVSATSPVTKSDITALGIPGQDTNTTYTLGSFGITATAAEINKLDGLTATTAELNYVDGVTSNIQTQLNGKSPTTHSHSAATTSANGFMSSSDKSKLDGIASGANRYTHPTSAGNKHIPSGGSSGQILQWSSNGTAKWGTPSKGIECSAARPTGQQIGDYWIKLE